MRSMLQNACGWVCSACALIVNIGSFSSLLTLCVVTTKVKLAKVVNQPVIITSKKQPMSVNLA